MYGAEYRTLSESDEQNVDVVERKVLQKSMTQYRTVAYGEAGSLNYMFLCMSMNNIGSQNFQ